MAGANGRRPEKPAGESAAHPVRPRRRTGRPRGATLSDNSTEKAPSEGAAPSGLALPADASPADVPPSSASAPPGHYQFSRLAVARAVYAAARSTPGVVGVGSSGVPGVRTYGLPGQTVEGVRVIQTSEGLEIEVHLTAQLIPLPPLADQVRRAIARALPGKRLAIHVYVDALEES